ncbi:hypothetical protein PENTCL1PPCAC_19064, partial [Pristionchus entomophagus]
MDTVGLSIDNLGDAMTIDEGHLQVLLLTGGERRREELHVLEGRLRVLHLALVVVRHASPVVLALRGRLRGGRGWVLCGAAVRILGGVLRLLMLGGRWLGVLRPGLAGLSVGRRRHVVRNSRLRSSGLSGTSVGVRVYIIRLLHSLLRSGSVVGHASVVRVVARALLHRLHRSTVRMLTVGGSRVRRGGPSRVVRATSGSGARSVLSRLGILIAGSGRGLVSLNLGWSLDVSRSSGRRTVPRRRRGTLIGGLGRGALVSVRLLVLWGRVVARVGTHAGWGGACGGLLVADKLSRSQFLLSELLGRCGSLYVVVGGHGGRRRGVLLMNGCCGSGVARLLVLLLMLHGLQVLLLGLLRDRSGLGLRKVLWLGGGLGVLRNGLRGGRLQVLLLLRLLHELLGLLHRLQVLLRHGLKGGRLQILLRLRLLHKL